MGKIPGIVVKRGIGGEMNISLMMSSQGVSWRGSPHEEEAS